MESVATQLLRLLTVAGLWKEGSEIPFPVRWLIYHRSTSGVILVKVPKSECLAITSIEASGIDYSAANTMAVRNSTDSLALNPQPLQTVIDSPALYVFGPGDAIFTFVFTAQPLATARVQIHGFRLPNVALKTLGRIATEQKAFA